MEERRLRPDECLMHGELMNIVHRIETKLDVIDERQIEYIREQAVIKGIVTNGLSSNVQSIKDKIEDMCGRLTAVEDFKWFRVAMTRFRDNMFLYVFRAALLGGGLYVIVRFGDEIIKGYFGK
jgi:hypothetical protein